MKLIDAINTTDALKPNSYTLEDKVKWLSVLDSTVKTEIIDAHEDGENVVFTGYSAGNDLETELLIPAPYEDIYIRWLEARIDYANAEIAKYNNAITEYNALYSAYRNLYNRIHMPKGKTRKYFG